MEYENFNIKNIDIDLINDTKEKIVDIDSKDYEKYLKKDIILYTEYISKMLNQTINYIEYLAEELNNNIFYCSKLEERIKELENKQD